MGAASAATTLKNGTADDADVTVPLRRISRFLDWIASGCLVLVLLAFAFRRAWLATHDLAWPYDIDLFRDAAFAQTILDGRFPADAFYSGEQNWYNPFPAFLVAAIARLFAIEPIQIYAHCGSFIALAIPVAVFILAVKLFGRWTGLAALFAFMFLGPNDVPPWAAPSYSPWLFANLIALVPCALTITTALWARENDRNVRWAICGVLLGTTFLAHTAAAVVAGSIALALGFQRRSPGNVARRCALVLIPAFIVSLPLSATILFHYGLHVETQDYIWDETDLRRLGGTLGQALTLGNAVALGGLVALFRNRNMQAARVALSTWLVVSGLLLVYGYIRQAWPHARLPGLVPPFHWLFYLRLVRALLLGYGLSEGVRATTAFLARWWRVKPAVALTVTLAVLLMLNQKQYSQRFDFEAARSGSLNTAARPGFAEAISYLRHETPPDAVVLAPPLEAVIMLGAAARQTVFIDRLFSNPYVPLEPRADAARSMFASLEEGQRDTFIGLAAKYHVSYVLLVDASPESLNQLEPSFVKPVFSRGWYTILRVSP